MECRKMVKINMNHWEEFLPRKKADSHKNSNGKALAIVGSYGMAGAAILSAEGINGTGLGYLHLHCDESIYPIIANHIITAVYHLEKTLDSQFISSMDSILVGCGCDHRSQFDTLMNTILQNAQCPLVLDATALHWFKEKSNSFSYASPLILTPHLGEFSMLSGLTVNEILENRVEHATQFAMKHHCILVLKGPQTLIVDETGRIHINQTGNQKLARAGSGDVLAGLITGFVAQIKDPFVAVVLAVHLHGLSADLTQKSEWTFNAQDIPVEIARILDEIK